MSVIAIHYKSLEDSASEAKKVATKLDDYAESVYKSVGKKLSRYSGPASANIDGAISAIDRKQSDLWSEAKRYRTYAQSLSDLKTDCCNVDQTVKRKVSALSAQFKSRHNIQDSNLENCLRNFFNSLINSSNVGRWLKEKHKEFNSYIDQLKDSIKKWYRYEGGKEYLKGYAIAALEIAIGVAVILSGGGVLAMLGAGIAIINGVVNLGNEMLAYCYAQNNDPATARRRSNLNTLTDTMRADSDDKSVHALALGIDIVKIVCDVVQFVGDGIKVLQNGYKWLKSGGLSKLKDIDLKSFFSKGNLSRKWSDFKMACKSFSWEKMKKYSSDLYKVFKNNIKSEYFDFKSEFEGAKTFFQFAKDLIETDLNLGNLLGIGVDKVLKPGILGSTLFPGVKEDEDASWTDLFDLWDDGIDIGKDILSAYQNSKVLHPSSMPMNVEVDVEGLKTIRDKLSMRLSSNIIPDIRIGVIRAPQITLPVIRVPQIRWAAMAA